ncbi:MAG: hypothetical protein LC749_01035, partial [Actinobacteria bacterium]|nr:hypothetical protein [Actinomycetota bacterium]
MDREYEANESSRQLVDALQAQLARNEEAIRGIINSWDRLFGLGLLVFTGGLSLGLKEERREVLLFMPAAILIVLLLGTSLLLEMMARGAYNKHLENRINEELNAPVAYWESSIGPVSSHSS